MEPLVKFYLVKLDKKIIFQVSAQRKRQYPQFFYNKDGNSVYIQTSNSSDISGLGYRDGILSGQIYLRGNDRGADFRESYMHFNNNLDRDKGYEMILELFSEWSEYIENIESENVENDPVHTSTISSDYNSSTTIRFRSAQAVVVNDIAGESVGESIVDSEEFDIGF